MKPIVPAIFYILSLFASYLTLTLLQMQGMADDPGLGWHLETGRYVIKHSVVPTTDPFLVSATMRPWVSDQWLSDVFFAFTLGNDRWWLVYGLITVIYLAAFYGPLYKIAADKSSVLAAAIAAVFCTKLGVVHFVVRPVVLSFVFFAAVITLATHIYDKRNIGKKEFLLGALIFLLWANLHPSFIIGLAVLAILLVSIILEKFFSEKEFPSSLTNQLIIFGLLMGCVTLLNPQGWALHESIVWLSRSDYFMNLHDEWKGINFKSPEGEWFSLVMAIVVSGFALFGTKALSCSTFHFLLCLVFSLLTCRSIRFLPYSALVCMLPLALVIHTFLKSFPPYVKTLARTTHSRVSYLVFAVCFMSLLLTYKQVPLYNGNVGPTEAMFPYKELASLKKDYTAENPARVLAHPNWGGFITWQGQGVIKAYTDDRNTLLGEAFTKELLEALQSSVRAQEYTKKINATHLLVRNKDPLSKELTQHPVPEIFQLVSQSEIGSLYKVLP